MSDVIHTSPVFIITALLNGQRWARYMLVDDGTTKRLEAVKAKARSFRKAGHQDVKLSRCTDQRTIDAAQFQIDKLDDWTTDPDFN